MKNVFYMFLVLAFCSCTQNVKTEVDAQNEHDNVAKITQTSLYILGTIQDAGSPHIACNKACCTDLFLHPDQSRKVVSLGLIDAENHKTYLFEATPDMPAQMKLLKKMAGRNGETPDGIFLTHAHIGHYTGLMYLGKEAMNAYKVPVYAMPKMKVFLEQNGPWSQLFGTENIVLEALTEKTQVQLSDSIRVLPFLVPHRDEYSETVGYKIIGPHKSALFIPDINKWQLWEKSIIDEIANVDFAFVDATFYDGAELNNRDMAEIPHPFIVESMALFADLPVAEKNKIYFIHFNHTNPVLNLESDEAKRVLENGFHLAQMHDVFKL